MNGRTLAIDTATAACSVALFENGSILASHYHEIGRGHAEKLVPLLASLPDKGRADHVIVNCGPGSFTGVRIGISAAKALGLAWKVTVSGYQCLHLVAAQAQQEISEPEAVCVTMQAGHGEFFVQNYSADCIARDELESIAPEKVSQKVKSPFLAGTAAKDIAGIMSADSRSMPMLPNAAKAMLLGETACSLNVVPIYGRGPDAIASAKV